MFFLIWFGSVLKWQYFFHFKLLQLVCCSQQMEFIIHSVKLCKRVSTIVLHTWSHLSDESKLMSWFSVKLSHSKLLNLLSSFEPSHAKSFSVMKIWRTSAVCSLTEFWLFGFIWFICFFFFGFSCNFGNLYLSVIDLFCLLSCSRLLFTHSTRRDWNNSHFTLKCVCCVSLCLWFCLWVVIINCD